MPIVATYRCPKCKAEYRPLDAGARRFFCCGAPLVRVQGSRGAWGQRSKGDTETRGQGDKGTRGQGERRGAVTLSPPPLVPPSPPAPLLLCEVIPPRENDIDALAVETLLGSLATESLFSLEIAGDANGRRFLVRAPKETLTHIQRQIQAVYDQVDFREVPVAEDPAARPFDSAQGGLPTAMAEMVLRRPVYLPLRTYRDGDFREADPVRGLLGAFGDFEEGECALSQIVLSPAPPHWADRYQGSTYRIDQSFAGEAMTGSMLVRQFVVIGVVIGAVAIGVWALLAFLRHDWLSFLLAIVLFVGALAGVIFLYVLLSAQANIDPTMVQRKVSTPAYDAALRLVAVGKTRERAEARLRELAGAYRQFNLSSGNALVARRAVFDPQILNLERPTWWQEWLGNVTRLNVGELASLWHLPVGQGVQLVERTQAKRLLPLPEDVGEGILIGESAHQGQKIPVRLDEKALWRHIFMVAKTQKGKSTLMAHLAAEAMQRDTALVVIDPHGDLARSLLGLVPRARIGDVVYIDFSDTQQVVGLNLLDMSQGRNADAIVSNIVHVGELIWSDYWGPRMEDALRMALRTLLVANEILARRREKQFTLIDIPPLLELPNFRHRLLQQYVSDPDILQWWSGYFERLYESLRMDVINPVLTKIHRFSTHSVVRNIVGQSESTVNFRDLLDQRRILLVNTATGVIGPDAGGLLGAVLVDYINFAVREQMAIPDPSARARVVVVVDEFQSIPGVDYPGLLAELQKMGASFILATQALGQLDAINRVLRPAILSNVATLFVFQTSAEDADLLRHELDDAVTGTDIINLADYTCYVKTQVGRERLPVMHVETLPPQEGEREIVEQIVGQMPRYTRPASAAESARRGFQEQWYGREMNLLRQLIVREARSEARGSRSPERGEGTGTTARQESTGAGGQARSSDAQPGLTTSVPVETESEKLTGEVHPEPSRGVNGKRKGRRTNP